MEMRIKFKKTNPGNKKLKTFSILIMKIDAWLIHDYVFCIGNTFSISPFNWDNSGMNNYIMQWFIEYSWS